MRRWQKNRTFVYFYWRRHDGATAAGKTSNHPKKEGVDRTSVGSIGTISRPRQCLSIKPTTEQCCDLSPNGGTFRRSHARWWRNAYDCMPGGRGLLVITPEFAPNGGTMRQIRTRWRHDASNKRPLAAWHVRYAPYGDTEGGTKL